MFLFFLRKALSQAGIITASSNKHGDVLAVFKRQFVLEVKYEI